MQQLRIVIYLCFLTFIVGSAQAQDELPPIIALNEGGIYTVSVDGHAEMLVAPPENYQAIRETRSDPVTLFSAEWLSPDGQYLVYRVKQPIDPLAPINENTAYTDSLFLLDLQNGSVPQALELKAAANYAVGSVAWSPDGAFLYIVILAFNPGNDTSAWALEILERDDWTRQLHIDLNAPDYAMARRIFATETGVVVWDRGVQSPVYAFTLFDSSGEQINQFEVDWNVSPDVNLYINTPFTPLAMADIVRFALTHNFTGEILFQVDFATGEVSAFNHSHLSGMVSGSAPDSSIRLSPVFFSGDNLGLYIRDIENNYLGDIEHVKAHAFFVLGDYMGMQFSLAPDGQMLAYLQGDNQALMLWENGEIRDLDFTAEVVVWSAPLYVPIHDPNYFRG
jgi:hypothetical protein